ncbi:hypothetical protein ACFWB2_31885 [Streptomyces virginiae]|uniref:hypothetical protein n=1 Tax=Streptomyces virginiae TaxID=1961 RepID=UPI0036A222DE
MTIQSTNPKVFIPTHQRGFPGHLHLPAGHDPAPIVAEFPPGTFTWNESRGYAEFPVTLSQDVVSALHAMYSHVDMQYGRSEHEPEASTTVKRPSAARPGTWKAMGPRSRLIPA